MDNVIAIVPAAGAGRRFGKGTNKTFETLCGRPLLAWTLLGLAALPEIAEIIPVLKEPDMEYGVAILEKYQIPKVRRVAPGGKERQDSIFHGLKLISGHKGGVLVHDGVRPLLDAEIVRSALCMMDSGGDGVVLGVPVKDTIKEVESGVVRKTLRRETLWAVQTPQIFHYDTLFAAYERAMEEGFYATDDATLVERYGGRIIMVMGSYANIKITTPEDIKVAEAIMGLKGMPA